MSMEATWELTVEELLEKWNGNSIYSDDIVLLDLENDEYADPDGDFEYATDYVRMEGIERETDGCIRIDYEGGSCGFPPDHKIREIRTVPSWEWKRP